MMGETRVTEVKRHLDGRTERFNCALVLRRPHLIVVRFDHKRGRRAGGLHIPAGSRTFGFFWRRRPYLLYRIERPDSFLIAHRFDVVEDVRFGQREVSYLDLLLDVWVSAGEEPLLEDEDEVAEARQAGLLSRVQNRRIDGTKALLLRRWRSIIREAGALLSEGM